MENKKLNEQELEQVTGGQAVLPLKGIEAPEAGAQVEPEMVSASRLTAYCGSCKMYYSHDLELCPKCNIPLMKPFI